jgi:acyl carrier protein
MIAAIQRLLDRETQLALSAADIRASADLYALGLTSFAAVRLLLAVEREFHVELPPEMLKRETARSIEAIAAALHAVLPAAVFAEGWREAA